VEEIEGGYFDKLRATPISRMSLVLGRLYAEFLKTVAVSTVMVALAMLFGIRIAAGFAGFLVLVALVAAWAMVFSGFMQLVALKTRSAAATQGASMIFFPLLFLTPNFVPRDQLTRPMEIAATLNPVTYIMEAARSLILDGFDGPVLAKGFTVIAVTMALMLVLSVRMINSYD
jgi:ABC-2 type transport system permease protein